MPGRTDILARIRPPTCCSQAGHGHLRCSGVRAGVAGGAWVTGGAGPGGRAGGAVLAGRTWLAGRPAGAAGAGIARPAGWGRGRNRLDHARAGPPGYEHGDVAGGSGAVPAVAAPAARASVAAGPGGAAVVARAVAGRAVAAVAALLSGTALAAVAALAAGTRLGRHHELLFGGGVEAQGAPDGDGGDGAGDAVAAQQARGSRRPLRQPR